MGFVQEIRAPELILYKFLIQIKAILIVYINPPPMIRVQETLLRLLWCARRFCSILLGQVLRAKLRPDLAKVGQVLVIV